MENNVVLFKGYPIFDEEYRKTLEKRIIDFYYFREIGVDNWGEFVFKLNAKMNLIMPMYNKFYESARLDLRILDNYDVTETFKKTNTTIASGVTNNESKDNNSNLALMSDTPQGKVDINSNDFVSNIGKNTGFNSTNGSIDTSSNLDFSENWARTMQGNIGVQTDMQAVVDYQNGLRNIDLLIIGELSDLFMLLY